MFTWPTVCAKRTMYPLFTGHNLYSTGTILKIYNSLFSENPELDSRILCEFLFFFFLSYNQENTESNPKSWIKFSKDLILMDRGNTCFWCHGDLEIDWLQ